MNTRLIETKVLANSVSAIQILIGLKEWINGWVRNIKDVLQISKASIPNMDI